MFLLTRPGRESIVFCSENENLAEKWMAALKEATCLEGPTVSESFEVFDEVEGNVDRPTTDTPSCSSIEEVTQLVPEVLPLKNDYACPLDIEFSHSQEQETLIYREIQEMISKLQSESDSGVELLSSANSSINDTVPTLLMEWADSQQVQMSGFLKWRRGNDAGWKKNWFALKDEVLSTFNDRFTTVTRSLPRWTLETLADVSFHIKKCLQ